MAWGKAKQTWRIRQNGVADKATRRGEKGKMARRRRKEAGIVPISYARAYYIMRSPLLLVFLQIERNAAQVNSTAYKRTSPNNSRRHRLTNSSTQKNIKSKSHPLQNSSPPKLTNLKTHPLKNSSTRKLTNSKAHPLKRSFAPKLTNLNAHQLKKPSTPKLIHLKAHQLKNSPT